jgi:endonuclease YncB( thermonuclease family)
MALGFSVILGALYYFQQQQPSTDIAGAARLLRVIDGDTIEAHITGYGRERVRLSSIDAPERSQAYGDSSTSCLEDILDKGELTVKVKKTDRYGRLVANLYVNGDRVDLQMVQRGCAWHYTKYAPASISLYLAQMRAKAASRGLWDDDNAIPPWDWRRKN